LFELDCLNVSTQAITVESLEPLHAVRDEGGKLHWAEANKILTNGPMYYDPGVVADLAAPGAQTRRSWWNLGFFRGYEREGLVCGYVLNQTALGQVEVRRKSDGTLGLLAESVLAKGLTLPPGQSIGSGRFMLNIAPDPYTVLETYADAMGTLQSARVHSVLNGWCDWFSLLSTSRRRKWCATPSLPPVG
jgi:hypothetical protein